MATALSAQLAQIRAQSTNSLDLKAQRKAHSQSLLFDPSNAAAQDFDFVYQICYKGFQELCRLDSRFTSFAGNIFSEQSKIEDRTQMTAAQNRQLDVVLEEFLSLVGSRLLLRPALKAVEWLVRRFRVHENNTLCLVLTFLPYHTTAIFPTILSILPRKIPPTLRFLHPYIQSLANPPRHTIVHTASHSYPFLSVLSTYVLQTSRMDHLYSTLLSFWASIATEAAAAMIDNARSARREAQKQNHEDVVLFFLPILNEGLSLDTMTDLRIGCYMILTVLASKADLSDGVVTAMMEAVVSKWSQTSHAGLICLSVLAQQKEEPELPKKVFKAVLALEELNEDLSILGQQYKVDKLVLGLVLGVTNELDRALDANRLRLVRTLMEADLMAEASVVVAVKSMLSTVQGLESFSKVDVQGSIADLLLRLAESTSIGNIVQTTVESTEHDVSHLETGLQREVRDTGSSLEQMIEHRDIDGAGGRKVGECFDVMTSRIPAKTAYEVSFLSHSESYVFSSLADTFAAISNSDVDIERFSDLPVLRKALASTEPLFLSFYVRFWCGNGPSNARAAAIRTVSRYIGEGPLKADVQILLPYVIHALADPAPKVRRSATELLLELERAYTKAEKGKRHADIPILGHEQVYGQGKEIEGLSWLSLSESRKFMADLMVPGAEECLLDRDHISQLLSDSLCGSKHNKGSNTIGKDLKTSLRLAIFSFLGSHVVHTPLHTVKYRLLQMLNRVTKVSSTPRTKILFPLVSHCLEGNQDDHERICQTEQLDPLVSLNQIVEIVIPNDRDGIQALTNAIEFGACTSFPSFKAAALRRIRFIWPAIKPDLQASIANILLARSLTEGGQDIDTNETLRALPLSTMNLQRFVEALPSISSTSQDPPRASKRRRTSHGHAKETASDSKTLTLAIKHITLVLELIEGAKTERHPELLKGLFAVFSDLQQPPCHLKAAIDYLLVLTLDSMLAIVKQAAASPASQIVHSAVRADVLVECVRTTTNPQVRNTILLLVSALANVAPESILHSVMPIFTFMSDNVLRRDDDFSAHVVKQTMDSVVPRLVQSLHREKDGPYVGISEILLSFAAAYQHIPIQRRLGLFTSLIDKVGSSEYLFALLVILVNKYPNDQQVLQFAADLASRYSAKVRLRTMEKYLRMIIDARQAKPTFSASLLTKDKNDTVASTIVPLLQLPKTILSDRSLASKVTKALHGDGEDAGILRRSYAQMLENIFLLAEEFRGNKKLDVPCMKILDASLGLPPMLELIGILHRLLEHTNDSICYQVILSFERRLSDAKLAEKPTQTACLEFLPRLLSIIKDSQDIHLKQVAVSCVDKISEKLGKKDISAVVECAQTISSDLCLGSGKSSLRVASLICLATMVETAAEGFVSSVPYAFAKAMDHLASSILEDANDTTLHNAVYTFLSALLLYLPWVVTGKNLDRLLELSYESNNAELGEECDQRRKEALQLIPRNVDAKECFAALKRTWPRAVREGPQAIKEYLEVLRIAIDRYSKHVIVKHTEMLGDLLLRLFDMRRIQLSPPIEDSYTTDEIEEVEDDVNESAIAMIYKLNDATFRPLFLRMLEWTNIPDLNQDKKTCEKAVMYRQATWYKFLHRFFDRLKSIVTTYAGFILEESVEILEKTSPRDKDSMFLWRQVILTLHMTFEHDQDDFYQSPSHFAPAFAALISQLANAAHIPLLPELIPAIAALAIAADSEDHLKEMNTAILQHMRSENSAVRLAAVQSERALTGRLGEEWLADLPQMLPFINEATEDDDEAVEGEVQRWKADIENILGESLNPMLQ